MSITDQAEQTVGRCQSSGESELSNSRRCPSSSRKKMRYEDGCWHPQRRVLAESIRITVPDAPDCNRVRTTAEPSRRCDRLLDVKVTPLSALRAWARTGSG